MNSCQINNFHFRINDRVISANNISLEGVDYATAVQVLRDSGQSVNLVVKRRLVLPPSVNGVNPSASQNTSGTTSLGTVMSAAPVVNSNMRVTLMKSNKKKDEFGLVLGCKIYIKQILNASLADKDENITEGDILNSINGISLDGMSLKEAKKLVESFKDKLDLAITKFQETSIHANTNANAGNSAEDKSLNNGQVESTREPESLKDNNQNGIIL